MKLLALTLAFLLVVTSLPVTAATPEGAQPEVSSTATLAPTASVEAPKPDASPSPQPTLREMLAQSPRADFAAGDRPSSTLAPAQAEPAEAAPAKKSHKTLWIVLGCIAGAAVIWAIADSSGGDDGNGGGGGGY